MNSLIIDTQRVVTQLEAKGFTRAQADGITAALKELDASALATKNDLELALAKQTTTIIKWVSGILVAHAAFVVALVQFLK